MKIAKSNTKDNLLILINNFYYSTNCIITDNNEVVNTKLNKTLGIVKETKKGFEYHAYKV